MNKQLIAAAVAAITTVAALPAAQAQDTGNLIIRARAVNLDSANKDTTGLDLNVNNKVIPEVDISYFFTPNIAAELILTIPQKHTIYAGDAKIGTLKHLPPTLTAQYHFTPGAAIRPYVGAGINLTLFSGVEFEPAVVAALNPSIKKSSVGLALQAGVDFELSKTMTLNLDVKKVQIGTDVKSNGTKVGEFKVDPLLLSVGFGRRF